MTHIPNRYFVQQGCRYELKRPKGIYITMAIAALAALYGVFALFFAGNTAGALALLLLVALFALAAMRATGTFVIDKQRQEIETKSFFFTTPQVFPISSFQNFYIHKTSYVGITAAGAASLIMNIQGKEKHLLLAQSLFTMKPLQPIVDETAAILHSDNG